MHRARRPHRDQVFGTRENGALPDGMLDVGAERLIAGSRAVLAICGLLAIYLDPSQPSQGVYGYAFVGGYAVYALLLFLATLRLAHNKVWAFATHIIEICLVCLIIVSIEGPSSPYFVYFTFILFAATLRWQWRGALLTGALLSTVLMVLSVTQLMTETRNPDLDRLILRNVYLLVASVLFAFLGNQLSRSQQRSERLRLARELHDGILQMLTAVRFKLNAVVGAVAENQRGHLLEISNLLKEEQNHIRAFVEESRDGRGSDHHAEGAADIAILSSYAEFLRRLWGCEIDLSVAVPDSEFPAGLFEALRPILAEAVANAVVHGKSTRIGLAIAKSAGSITLSVKDNGSGLPNAVGTYDHAQLVGGNLGPRSLRERVAALGGSLRLTTSEKGMELEVRLPVFHAAGRS